MKTLKPHPLERTLGDVMRDIRHLQQQWLGVVFRSVELEFARSAKLLDGKGSLHHGSRWTAPGAFRSVSLSLDPVAADQEAVRRAAYYGLSAELLRPRVRVAVTAKLQKVLPVVGTSAGAGVVLAELLAEDWRKVNDAGKESLSQALARAARDHDAEALLVPSAAAAAQNLIVFVDKLLPGSELQIENQADLDRWLKKR